MFTVSISVRGYAIEQVMADINRMEGVKVTGFGFGDTALPIESSPVESPPPNGANTVKAENSLSSEHADSAEEVRVNSAESKPKKRKKHFEKGKKSHQVLWESLTENGKRSRTFDREMARSILAEFKYDESTASSSITRGIREGLFIKANHHRKRYNKYVAVPTASESAGSPHDDFSQQVSEIKASQNGGLFALVDQKGRD
jgi:hypothetical protein